MPPLRLKTRARPGLTQKTRDLLAAHAVMADDHDVGVRRQFLPARRHFLHRQQFRIRNRADCVFPRFAHVEHHGLGARTVGEPGLQCVRLQLLDQNTNLSGCGALRSAAMQVSNRPTVRKAPGASQVVSRAVMTGASPTIASRRPPVLRLN